MNKIRSISAVLLFAAMAACNNNPAPPATDTTTPMSGTPVINYAVKKFYPHDTSLYTEGFLIHGGQLFESTGSPSELPFTRSIVGITNLADGSFDKKIEIDKSKYFGEGIVFFGDKLYQLTYTNQLGFVYDARTFKKTGEFSFTNKQGWALTTNGKELIMSDGTDKLTFLDPVTLKPVRTLPVTENGLPAEKLNELEYIKGFIYANIWLTNFIVKIDPATGKVVGKLDLTSLNFEAKNKNPHADVLNGIAYDSIADKIYVTGKLWPNIYELQFAH